MKTMVVNKPPACGPSSILNQMMYALEIEDGNTTISLTVFGAGIPASLILDKEMLNGLIENLNHYAQLLK